MQATNHLDFIVAAYGATIAVVGALVAWVVLDYRAQLRALADLERRGFSRRSDPGPAPAAPSIAPAKEDA
jgi:heme exporter protein D